MINLNTDVFAVKQRGSNFACKIHRLRESSSADSSLGSYEYIIFNALGTDNNLLYINSLGSIPELTEEQFKELYFQQVYIIDESEFIGTRLEGIPVQIVEKMVENQVLQDNNHDYRKFFSDRTMSRGNGGFNWDESPESSNFWSTILDYNDYEYFYTKYDRKEILSLEIGDLTVTRILRLSQLKPNERYIISENPGIWSQKFGKDDLKNPLGLNFPREIVISEIFKRSKSYSTIKDTDGYGWNSDSLINKVIFKIKE